VEYYSRWWARSEKEEPDSLSEWIESIRAILESPCIKHVQSSAFNVLEVKKELNRLHEEYVLLVIALSL
jgi:hypothetical protein